jgi:hypothetical protein
MSDIPETSRRDLEIDILCATVAALMAVIVWGLTWNTVVQNGATLCQMLGMTWLLVTAPGIFSRFCSQVLSRSAVGLLVFLGCCALGRTPDSIAHIAAKLIALSGCLTLGITLWHWLRLKPLLFRSCLRIAVLAILFVAVLIPYAWGFGNRNPVMMYGLVHGMSAFADNVYHASIATMLDVHSISSTGLDGVPYVHYHWCSHLMIASLASLNGILPLEFYATGYGVMVLPFCLWCFLEFSQNIETVLRRERTVSSGMWGQLILIIGFSGFLIDRMWDRGHSRWDHNLMISESQVMGVAILLLGIAIFLPWIRRLCFSTQETDPRDRREFLWLIPCWCFVFAIIMSMKISSGHLLTAVLFPVAFLASRNRMMLVLAAIASMGVMLVLSPWFTSLGGAPISFEPLQYARKNFLSSQGIEYVVLTVLYPILYSWVRISRSAARTPGDLYQLAKTGEFRDVVIVWLAVGAGVAPMLLISGPMAFNTMYYQSAVQVFSLLMLSAAVNATTHTDMTGKWFEQKLSNFALKMFVLTLLVVSSTAVWQRAFDLIRDNLLCRGSAVATVFRQEPIAGKACIPAKLRGGQFVEVFRLFNENTQVTEASMESGCGAVVKSLWELGKQPYSVRSKSALWIPKTNRQFWELHQGDFSRSFTSVTAVALAGMALIDGYPEENSANGYGFDEYPVREKSLAESLDLEAVLHRAADLGFSAVVELQPEGRLVWHRELN